MQIISPVSITDAEIGSHNVLDEPEWDVGATYSEGDDVQYFGVLYESLTNSNTGNQPDTSPSDWIEKGAIAHLRPFDGIVDSTASNTYTIEYEITPGAVVSGIAFFGLQGSSLTIVMNDPTAGEVYNKTVNLQDNAAITGWYTWLFSPIVQKRDVVRLDLPSYRNATITITINAGEGVAQVGEIVMGLVQRLGITNHETAPGIKDYSVKDTDDFGRTIITKRAFAKTVDYDVTVETRKLSAVVNLLARRRSEPTVYVGSSQDGFESTIVYGFYRDFDTIYSTPTLSDLNIFVEGLT